MFRQLYGKVISAICNDNTARINQKIYLMFHSIEDEASNNNSIYHLSVIQFSKICKFINSIKIDALNNFGIDVEFVFTFDDGYKNYINNAIPILDKYSFKSIIFLIAENLNDKSGKYINREDIRLLKKKPRVIIGMHGHSHVDLSLLSDKGLESEFANIKEICDTLNFSTSYFSLPFGRADDNVVSKLIEQGYTEIFTSDYGYKVSNRDGANLYPRIDIWSDDSNNVIKQKIMQCWKLFFIVESYRAKLYRIN